MPDGFAPIPRVIRAPEDLPADAPLIIVRPRSRPKVAARLAEQDGSAVSSNGAPMQYRAGEHYIVESGDGDVSVVRRDIFEKMYHRVRRGIFRKRDSLRLRAAVADGETTVQTLEGPQPAHRGDWIMIGVADEMWPVPASIARTRYREAAAVSFSSVTMTVLLVFLLLTYFAIAST